MEIKKLIGPALIALPLCLFSCIKDEAPNVEADIEQMTITQDFALINGIPKPFDNRITVILRKGLIDLNKDLAPQFVLSPGATISPASGDTLDFTNPVEYTVTSEDKRYQNKYVIRFKDITPLPTHYTFENWRTTGKYLTPYEISMINITPDSIVKDTSDIWASGNGGFALVAGPNPSADAFPTRYTETTPFGKKALCLETVSTGPLGAVVKMPLAAGNLFIGEFDANSAMKKPLEATHFGSPFDAEPLKFSFYYKYKPTEISPGVIDECDIYAVLFETDETVKYLDGTNVLTHPYIVAMARISNPGATIGDDMVFSEVLFDYRKKIDPTKLKNFNYSLAVVFSSSRRGAEFIGGIGSTLIVDEAIVTCKK